MISKTYLRKGLVLNLVFAVTLFELFIGGGGRLIDIGFLSLRMYLFIITSILSLSFLFLGIKVKKEVWLLFIIYWVLLFFSSIVALFKGTDIALIGIDLKPLIFFYSIIYFSIMITQKKDVETVVRVVKVASILLAITYIMTFALMNIGVINFKPFWESVYDSKEFFFRGEVAFMYKGFIYLCIGFFFFFRGNKRRHTLITLLLVIAIFLTFTRGFILVMALTYTIYIIFYQRNRALTLFLLLMIPIGILSIWDIINSDFLGDKGISDSIRVLQLEQVFADISIFSLFFGHGFGTGVDIREIHMEIAYLEIFHKQGLIGLLFWTFLFISIFIKFKQASINGSFNIALPFFLSTLFVYLESFTNPFILSPLGMSWILISWICLDVLRRIPYEDFRMPSHL